MTPGQVLDVDYLALAEGARIELDRVLLVANDDNVTLGTPTVDGAKVFATSQGGGKGKKIIVLRYKPKVRYRRKTGHRQLYTRLAINEIVGPGIVASKPVKPVRRPRPRKTEVSKSGA